ncbi:hypothetical protein ACFTS5_02345 [Nocardia sp. NPDC056952]|uniref:hypothetical protein n=1 Tax=Nocardia sp. NPDC056952 TaxID=3345979 RepID=UPI00363CBEA0
MNPAREKFLAKWRALYIAAGEPQVTAIARETKVPYSTLAGWFADDANVVITTDERNFETVLLYLHAKSGKVPAGRSLDVGALRNWQTLRRNAGKRSREVGPVVTQSTAVYPRLGECDPLRDLGIQPAPALDASVDSDLGLTPYVEREHDAKLRAKVKGVVDGGRSVLVMLTGDSSTGKTRSLYEALREKVPDTWRLLAPTSASELVASVEAIGSLRSGCVLWLNEAQRVFRDDRLATSEVAAKKLDDLLKSTLGVVAVGTLWTREYWNPFTQQGLSDDPRANLRDLLTRQSTTKRIPVPSKLLDRERQRWEICAQRDARLRVAYAAGSDGKIVQHVSVGPELLAAYRQGPGTHFTVCEYAVLTAALEARRLGHSEPLTTALLAEAAWNTLADRDRPGETDWAEQTLVALSTGQRTDGTRTDIRHALTAMYPVHDAPGVLAGWEVADYLLQHGRGPFRKTASAAVWQAVLRHTENFTSLHDLGYSAYSHKHFQHAARLWRKAIERGHPTAARGMLLVSGHPPHDRDYRGALWIAEHTAVSDLQTVRQVCDLLAEAHEDHALTRFMQRVRDCDIETGLQGLTVRRVVRTTDPMYQTVMREYGSYGARDTIDAVQTVDTSDTRKVAALFAWLQHAGRDVDGHTTLAQRVVDRIHDLTLDEPGSVTKVVLALYGGGDADTAARVARHAACTFVPSFDRVEFDHVLDYCQMLVELFVAVTRCADVAAGQALATRIVAGLINHDHPWALHAELRRARHDELSRARCLAVLSAWEQFRIPASEHQYRATVVEATEAVAALDGFVLKLVCHLAGSADLGIAGLATYLLKDHDDPFEYDEEDDENGWSMQTWLTLEQDPIFQDAYQDKDFPALADRADAILAEVISEPRPEAEAWPTLLNRVCAAPHTVNLADHLGAALLLKELRKHGLLSAAQELAEYAARVAGYGDDDPNFAAEDRRSADTSMLLTEVALTAGPEAAMRLGERIANSVNHSHASAEVLTILAEAHLIETTAETARRAVSHETAPPGPGTLKLLAALQSLDFSDLASQLADQIARATDLGAAADALPSVKPYPNARTILLNRIAEHPERVGSTEDLQLGLRTVLVALHQAVPHASDTSLIGSQPPDQTLAASSKTAAALIADRLAAEGPIILQDPVEWETFPAEQTLDVLCRTGHYDAAHRFCERAAAEADAATQPGAEHILAVIRAAGHPGSADTLRKRFQRAGLLPLPNESVRGRDLDGNPITRWAWNSILEGDGAH